MTERLLTLNEMYEIYKFVRRNPVLRDPNVVSLGNEITSIYKVSPKNGIVFVKGNEHTGFTHIIDRHNYWSENYYWKNENDNIILDNPSKFSSKSSPLPDFVNIADMLYSKDNLNTEKNKRPDLFDLYSGIVEDENNGKMKYHMLLYKDTKIIHTLYPNNKKHNRNKYINLIKGKPKGHLWQTPLRYTIGVPYIDHNGKVLYSFQIMKEFENKIETGILIDQINDIRYDLFERTFEKFDYKRDLFDFQYADLSKIEKIIKQFEEKNNNC